MFGMHENNVVVKSGSSIRPPEQGDIYQIIEQSSYLYGKVYILAVCLNERGKLGYNLIGLNSGTRCTMECDTPEELIAHVNKAYKIERVGSCGECTITIDKKS